MKLKNAGFYKEEGYSEMPSIFEFVKEVNPKKRKMPWKFRFYLSKSPAVVYTSGKSLIDGSYFTLDGWQTDGKWIWKTSIIYYYENHGIDLPEEFKTYLRWKFFPYPILFGILNSILRNKLIEKVDRTFTHEMERKISQNN